MFSYKMGNFYKESFEKKLFPICAKRENNLKKGAPKGTVSLGAPLFCSIHQRARKKSKFYSSTG